VNIFIRRKRSGTAENSNIGGAGIGLTIARDIMIKHKGNIRTYPSQLVRIKGLEHHKTVFEVMLPLLNT
jgi:signal transduction histidine kinase